MTALTADRNTQSKEVGLISYPVAGSARIYKGSMVCLNSSGYLVPASDTSGLSNCVGVADEKVDNSSGGNGAKSCRVVSGRRFRFAAVSISQAMVGDEMFVVDDQTFDDSAGVSNNIRAGVLVEFESTTSGWILIGIPAITPGTIGTPDISNNAITVAKLNGNLKSGTIHLDLLSLREISTNDIPNAAGNGGLLAKDTTPVLERVNGSTDKALRVAWAPTVVDEVQFPPVPLPHDLDEASNLTIHLMVYKDANMDATANIDVQVFAGVGDTEMGGATPAITETAPTEKTVTILAADIPAPPNFLNISLVPSAHANDSIYLVGAWIEYTRVN